MVFTKSNEERTVFFDVQFLHLRGHFVKREPEQTTRIITIYALKVIRELSKTFVITDKTASRLVRQKSHILEKYPLL